MTNRKKTETRNIRVSANVVVRQTKAGRFIARVSNGVTTTSVPIPEADTMQSAITLVESSGIIEVAKARQPQAVAERYRHIMSKSEGGMTNEFLIREYIRDREFRGITPRTTEVDEDALRRLIDISESHQLASVNEGDINAFANSPETKRTLSLSTRGGRLNRLNLFYQWMIKSGHYHSSNPCKNVRVVRAGTPQEKMIVKSGKPFTEEEVNELVRRAKEGEDYPWWLRFVVLIAAETGLRKGDCFNMDWASYDRSDNVLVIVTSKTGATARFPINDNLQHAIDLAAAFHKEVTGESEPPKSGPMLKSWANRYTLLTFWFRRLAEGIIKPGHSLRSLRRSAAIREQANKISALLGGNADMARVIIQAANEAARQKLGHSNVKMTEHYLKQ